MNLEEIKKLYEECEQNVDALAFEMAIPVAELMARGKNEAADKLDKENQAILEDFMRNHVGGLCDTIADVRVYLFGMRDVIGNNPDNDYQQGQLNVIEKLLDATAG